jgi:hypothetical protein
MGPFQDGWTKDDIEDAIARDDHEALIYAPIIVSLDPPDSKWAEDICIRLALHAHPQIRANAILGFGHLARTMRNLSETQVRPVVLAALKDPEDVVRAHAEDAASDIDHFLNWTPPLNKE